jgi:polar amino acid transport system substrate-binding protein
VSFDRDEVVNDLTRNGQLRAAINLGNPILAQPASNSDGASGVTVELAKALASRLEVPLDLVKFSSAGRVFDAIGKGDLSLVFLAIEPAREQEIQFTAPYVLIQGTFVVRESHSARAPLDIDERAQTIAVVGGSAYDLYLSRVIQKAQILRFSSHEAAVNAFKVGEANAIAGIRQPMIDLTAALPGLRLIEEPFMTIRQAMGVPQGRTASHAYLKSFIEDMKKSGFVFDALVRNGQRDFEIAPLAANG